jgi:RNA polymerase sigma-70 factor (ECF subfamily)
MDGSMKETRAIMEPRATLARVSFEQQGASVADQRDFDEFYVGTRVRLLRQLTAMTGDAEQAADVLQEAYARAWQRWRRVSGFDEPAAWVRVVAWRIAVSQHRRAVVGRDRSRRFFGASEAVDLPPHSDEVLDIRTALRQLSPEHRRALVLYEMCGLSVPQVAAETGVAEGTVKSRLARARAALAARLGADYLDVTADAAVEGEPS